MLTLKKRPAKQEPAKSPAKPPMPERATEGRRATEEEIRLLAHRKWEEAGCPASDGVEFWLAAEREILSGK